MASKRVRIVLWIAGLAALTAVVVTATVAFVIFRTVSTTSATTTGAAEAFAEIRKQFPERAPLIEVNPQTGDFRVNRTPNAPRKKVDVVHFMAWDPDDEEIVRGDAPIWITNLRISITGVGNWSFSDFHVTREDIERYSPGVIIDFKASDGTQAIAWTR